MRPIHWLSTAFLVAVVLAAPRSALPAERLFETSITYTTGSTPEGCYPHASRLADVNDDGFPDLVASNHWFPNTVSVLFHDGESGYSAPTLLTIGASSVGVEVADFTGDGRLDILAANTGSNYQGNTVSLLRNLGGASFAPWQAFPAIAGPAEMAAADFDLDGDVDAFVAGYGASGQGTQVALLRNNGSGGFLAPVLLNVGVGPSDLEIADLNSDGKPDLVVAREGQRLCVLMNNGAGGFAAAVEYVTQDFVMATDVYANAEVADIDRDGDLDVLYSSNRTQIDADYGAICYLKNQGDGTLGNRTYIMMPRYLGGAFDIALADVTGDEWLDLLTAHGGNGGWVVTPSIGNGLFGAGIEYAGGNNPMKMAAADVDSDGDLDALVLNRYSLTLGVHRNLGSGVFLEPGGRDLEPLCGWMDAADIDSDGDLDVVSSYAYAGGGGLSVIKNNGNGTFAPRQNYVGPRGAMTPRFDDMNGDGQLDLVWAFDATSPPYDFSVRLNQGAGQFGPAITWPVGTCGTGDLITMDVDNDGDRDVLMTDWLGCTSYSSPWVWIRRNNGDATFGPAYVLTYSTDPKEMAAADFNADGLQDLATVHADGVKIVLAVGGGQFGPPLEAETSDLPYVICAGDLNGDEFPDVATGNMNGPWEGTISILLNHGDGSLADPIRIRSAFSTEVSAIGQITAADTDVDGDLDILIMSYGGQDLLVYENDGNAGFALQNRYVIGAAPGDYRCLDFTGDSKPDIGAVIGVPPANLNKRFVVAPGIQVEAVGADLPAASVKPNGLEVRGQNPFADFTRLAFSLPARSVVELAIFDVSGRRVASLLNGALGSGEHLVTWDGSHESGARLGPGVYFARLTSAQGVFSSRVVMLR